MKNYNVYYISEGEERKCSVEACSVEEAESAVLHMLGDVPISDIRGFETNATIQKGRKNDREDDKLRWELLPLELIEEVVKVYTYGAKKYAPNTWQNLDDGYNRYKAALMRHIVAFEKGETKDEESGIHPLAHAAWNALAMLHAAQKQKS